MGVIAQSLRLAQVRSNGASSCADARASARCCHSAPTAQRDQHTDRIEYTGPRPVSSETRWASAAGQPGVTGHPMPTWPVRSWLTAVRHSGMAEKSSAGA